MRWMIAILSVAWACAGVRANAAETAIQTGQWKFSFKGATGDWVDLSLNNAPVAAAAPVATIDFQTAPGKWCLDTKISQSRLVDSKWDKASSTLTLVRRVGEWELAERIQFGAAGMPGCLARTMLLTYRPKTPAAPAAKFFRARFTLRLAEAVSYLTPGNDPFHGQRTGTIADLGAGASRGGGMVFVQQTGRRTVLFANDARRDSANVLLFTTAKGEACIAQEFAAQGWAEPNVTQTIGTAYLDVVPGDPAQVLPTAVHQWYDAIGLKVPADRPAWVRRAALYSFHPGGTVGSGCQDLGGFVAARDYLLPRLGKLGIGALWLLPLEDKGIYWPRDYYKFQEGLGAAEDYQSLVTLAHKLGMKVWQDLVPHGGSPEFGMQRGNKPWWLVFDEAGNALSYWCFDFHEPGWQQYIGKVADYYTHRFGIDGFRIDAVGGSHIMNWRRAGFPPADKVPANVPADWWKSSLATVGGAVPPLPYERGSLTRREGGLQMIHTIRSAVRKNRPDSGAVLGEVGGVPYMQEADVVYDFTLAHSLFREIRKHTPAEFVRGLQQYLQDQRDTEPSGTVRLRYVESHDTVRAQGLYGVDATRALMAVTAWIDGMPMFYHGVDVGNGPFLQRVIAVRKALPELQTGAADYQAVASDPQSVFTCLRSNNASASIVAVNLSPAPCDVSLTVLTERMPLQADTRYAVWNAMTGARLTTGSVADLRRIQLHLDGWEPTVLAFRNADNQPPIAAPPAAPAAAIVSASGAMPQVKEGATTVEVVASAYRLSIDRHTGLPRSFSGADGKPLLTDADLLLDATARDGEDLIAACSSTIQQAGGSPEVTCRLTLKTGGAVIFTYRCRSDRVDLNAALSDDLAARRIGIVFPGVDTGRYAVNTAEGLVDDWFPPRHVSGKRGSHNIYYRPQGTDTLWDAATQPLQCEHGFLRSWRHDGAGVEITVNDPLNAGLADAQVLDSCAGKAGWHALFLWRDSAMLAPPVPAAAAFELSLRPLGGDVADNTPIPPAMTAARVTNTSLGWLIENQFYQIHLLRTGGVIRELTAKLPAPHLIAENNDLYTDQGFRTERAPYAGAGSDGETSVRLWREGDAVHLRFYGMLRNADRFGILNHPIWFCIDYAFDNTAAFRVRWSFRSDGLVRQPTAFRAWMLPVPDGHTFACSRDGQPLSQGVFTDRHRSGETALLNGAPVPDDIRICGADGQTLLSISDLKLHAPASLHNVFVDGTNLFLAWLDGKAQQVRPGQWYEAAMTVTAGAAAGTPASPPLPWISGEETGTTAAGLRSPSFEDIGRETYLVGARRHTILGVNDESTWTIPPGGRITTEISHSGSRCAEVIDTSGDYRLFTQLLSLNEFPSGSQVRLSAWVKGDGIKRGDASWKVGTVGLSFLRADGQWQHGNSGDLLGTFDWRRVDGVFTVPPDATTMLVRVGLNGATGKMWIDDVKVEKVR